MMKNKLTVLLFCSCLVLGAGQTLGEEGAGGGFDHLDLDAVKTSAASGEPLLESTLKSFFVDTSAALSRWRSNHFTLYLFITSLLTGLGLGLGSALLAHYGCDPRAAWKDVRKKSTWLAAAGGLGAAVFLVGVMLPIPPSGRVTYLVLSAATCALSAALGCWFCFVVVRSIRQGRAGRSGLRLNLERMKGF